MVISTNTTTFKNANKSKIQNISQKLPPHLAKISLVSAGNVFNALLGLLFLTAIARTLPIEEFGKYALLTSLLVFASKITDFGTNSLWVAQTIKVIKITQNDKSELNTKNDQNLKNTFISAKIVLFAISAVFSLIALKTLNLLNFELFAIFSAGLIAYTLNLTLFAFFQKLEKFHLVVALNTIPGILKAVAAALILFNIVTPDLTQSFMIFSFSIFVSLFLAYYLPADFKSFSLSFTQMFTTLKATVPAGISLLITSGWSAIANTVAKLAKTFTDVGIFSVADKVANIFALISLSIFTVLLPKNARRKSENLTYDIKETLLLSGIILVLAFFATFFATFLFPKVFGVKFAESLDILSILIFASAFTAIHTFVDNYFFVEEKTKLMLLITISKLAVFLGLATLLVPVYSIEGLAYAQLFAAVFALVSSLGFVIKLSNSAISSASS